MDIRDVYLSGLSVSRKVMYYIVLYDGLISLVTWSLDWLLAKVGWLLAWIFLGGVGPALVREGGGYGKGKGKGKKREREI